MMTGQMADPCSSGMRVSMWTQSTSYSITEICKHEKQVVVAKQFAWRLTSLEEASCFCRRTRHSTWDWTNSAASGFLTYKQQLSEHHSEH